VDRALSAIRGIAIGDPAWAVYKLARYCGLDKARAIEALREMPGGEEYIGRLQQGG